MSCLRCGQRHERAPFYSIDAHAIETSLTLPMAARTTPLRCLLRAKPSRFLERRQLSVSAPRGTDGVFRELTDQRVQVPWVEAFRKREREGHDPTKASGKPQTPENRDLSAKKMSDSYHSVVRLSPEQRHRPAH